MAISINLYWCYCVIFIDNLRYCWFNPMKLKHDVNFQCFFFFSFLKVFGKIEFFINGGGILKLSFFIHMKDISHLTSIELHSTYVHTFFTIGSNLICVLPSAMRYKCSWISLVQAFFNCFYTLKSSRFFKSRAKDNLYMTFLF